MNQYIHKYNFLNVILHSFLLIAENVITLFQIDFGNDYTTVIIFGQVRGYSDILLIPNDRCRETCNEIYVELQQGEMSE